MKLKIYLTLCFFLFDATYCFSQNVIRVSFFSTAGHVVKTRDSAAYIRTIYEMDKATSLYDFKEEYANGKLRRVGKTYALPTLQPEGLCTTYYPTGAKRSEATYHNGKPFGDEYEYYPNGKLYKHFQPRERPANLGRTFFLPYLVLDVNDSLGRPTVINGNGYFTDSTYWPTSKIVNSGNLKNGLREGQWNGVKSDKDGDIHFTEMYKDGKLISGFSVDQNNKKYTYKDGETEVTPQFPFGEVSFINFLRTHVVYPEVARKNNITGRVYVTFTVNKDGSLSDVKAVRSPSIELAAEAVRVMQESPSWEPGKYFGQPASFSYTVPINFTLNKSSQE